MGKEGVTTGASNDIQRATMLCARNMVDQVGSERRAGTLCLYDDEEQDPFNRGYGQPAKTISEETQHRIDKEVRRVIDECYAKAQQLLEDNRDILESMTQALMKYETISSEQIDQLMAREPVSPPDGWIDDEDKGNDSGASAQRADEPCKESGQDDTQDDSGVDPDMPSPDNNLH